MKGDRSVYDPVLNCHRTGEASPIPSFHLQRTETSRSEIAAVRNPTMEAFIKRDTPRPSGDGSERPTLGYRRAKPSHPAAR